MKSSELKQLAEKWLPVKGFEGVYEVSDKGRVRNISTHDSTGRPMHKTPRILKPGKGIYLKVKLSNKPEK